MPGATDFTEIIAWRLAVELRRFINSVTAREKVKRDRKFCEQADDAAGSAPRNIAEGFGRFGGKEFAQFLKIALGSLHETRNNILEGFDKGYITDTERTENLILAKRAIAAATRLRAYLLSPQNTHSDRRTSRTREPMNR